MPVYHDVIHQQYTPKSSKRQNVALNGFFTFNATNVYLYSANLFVLKAKRQLQKTSTSIGDEMNAVLYSCLAGSQTPAE
ncbi:hypothetical protein ACFPRA_24915 [Sporosarcina soli]|uniref:Uncharacterized protein n=1 Tax=Sporosarcina soli TaxID=334736 RepID=A0ABW0TUS8_9BACL